MDMSDAGLLLQWNQQRDARAFNQLVRRYSGMVYATCVRVLGDSAEAEDISQECFVKLTDADPNIAAHLGPWLHTVATRLSLNRRKSDVRRKHRETEYVQSQSSHVDADRIEMNSLVDEAIASLDQKVREIIVMHFLEGRSQRATAKALNVSRKTVSSRIDNGIGRIREGLKKRGVEVGVLALGGIFASEAAAAPPSLVASLGKHAIAGRASSSTTIAASPINSMSFLFSVKGLLALAVTVGLVSGITHLIKPERAVVPSADSASIRSANLPAVESAPAPNPPQINAAAQATQSDGEQTAFDPMVLEIRCVSMTGQPLADAEVFVTQRTQLDVRRFGPPSTARFDTQTLGPLSTDSGGMVTFELADHGLNAGGNVYAFARVPGELAGASYVRTPLTVEARLLVIELDESVSVAGEVSIPVEYSRDGISVHILGFARDELRRNRQFIGVVHDDGPGPIWPPMMNAKTDQNGRFVLRDIPREVTLRVSANGLGLGEAQWMKKIGSGITDAVLNMEPEGVIEGALLLESGKPAPGMVVYARGADLSVTRHPITGVTDRYGRFRIDGLAEGTYNVVALAENADTPLVANVVHGVIVRPGEVAGDVMLIAEPGSVVSGTIQNGKTGEPLSGASVVAQQTVGNDDERIATAETRNDGKFSLRLPTGDTELYLAKIPEGYVRPKDSGKIVVSINPGERIRKGVNFDLSWDNNAKNFTAKGTITGTVVDGQGNPIANVRVADRWEYFDGDSERLLGPAERGKTDSDGRFSVRLTAVGRHRITVGGGPYSATASEWVKIREDEVRELSTLTVHPLSANLRGIVVDPEGQPIADAKVMASADDYIQSEWEKTGRDGYFTLEHLPEGEVLIGVSRAGHETSQLSFYRTGEFVEITLHPKSDTTSQSER